MAEKPAIGFGGFLLGFGLGWLVFSSMTISSNVLAILLVTIGGTMVLSGILRWVKLTLFSNLVGGAMSGLILALLLTQGFNLFTNFSGTDFSLLPYSASHDTRLTGSVVESNIIFKSQNINGPVTIQTWDKDEYEVKLNIKAKGASQSEADKHLSEFTAEIKKNTQNEGTVFELVYSYPNVKNPPYEISVEVTLPAKVSIDIDSSSTNGSMMLANIQGKSIKAYTSNGRIQLNNVKADVFSSKTSNGAVLGDLDSTNCNINTSNSPIDLKFSISRSGKYSLSTSNGPIIIVATKLVGYTIDAKTSNSIINLNLPNLDYSVNMNTHKSASTNNLESYPIKLVLDIQTSNGNIEVSTISSGGY
jgi:hypothetical protein